jgi:predicted amidohydrolase
VRALARKGVELVISPTALGRRWGIVAEKVIPARAFENGVFLAYVDQAGTENGHAYAGLSCLVGPDGADRARAGAGEEVVTAEIDLADITAMRAAIPYLDELRGDVV